MQASAQEVWHARTGLRGRQRGGGTRRPQAERGGGDLPHHPRVADGRAGRRVVGRGPRQPLGHGARGGGDAVRGRGRRRAARRDPEGSAGDHLHRVAGPPADDPEPLQDRRGAVARGRSRGGAQPRHPRPVDLRRPQRRDGHPPDGVRHALRLVGPGGPRLRARGPRRHPPQPGAVRPLLRRVPHQPRDRQDQRAGRRRPPCPRPRGRRARPPAPGPQPESARAARHGSEPRRLLPGTRGVQRLPRRGPGHRPGGHGRAGHPHRPGLPAGRLRRARPTPNGCSC